MILTASASKKSIFSDIYRYFSCHIFNLIINLIFRKVKVFSAGRRFEVIGSFREKHEGFTF